MTAAAAAAAAWHWHQSHHITVSHPYPSSSSSSRRGPGQVFKHGSNICNSKRAKQPPVGPQFNDPRPLCSISTPRNPLSDRAAQDLLRGEVRSRGAFSAVRAAAGVPPRSVCQLPARSLRPADALAGVAHHRLLPGGLRGRYDVYDTYVLVFFFCVCFGLPCIPGPGPFELS